MQTYKTKGCSIRYNVAHVPETFSIKSLAGSEVVGQYKNMDFPGEKPKQDRGNIFWISARQQDKDSGEIYRLIEDAIIIIKTNGCKTLTITAPSLEEKMYVRDVVDFKIISEATKIANTGTTEHTIL